MFPLLSLLSSTEPSKEFIQSIIQLIPSNDVPREAHLQVIFTLFQRWAIKNKDAFVAAISELVSSMTDQTENESQHSLIKTFIVVMRSWWDSNLVAGKIRFIYNKVGFIYFIFY
jgi:hypothetical protein